MRAWTLPLIMLLAACSQAPVASETAPPPTTKPAAHAKDEPVMCKEPRPQACTMIYQPVCATRDTGVRCITTPCPSTEQVTKSSECNACNDAKVISYVPGECPAK
jgi:hypothetical protein